MSNPEPRKWSTFLQKPQREIPQKPQPSSTQNTIVDNPYKVVIQKQPKKQENRPYIIQDLETLLEISKRQYETLLESDNEDEDESKATDSNPPIPDDQETIVIQDESIIKEESPHPIDEHYSSSSTSPATVSDPQIPDDDDHQSTMDFIVVDQLTKILEQLQIVSTRYTNRIDSKYQNLIHDLIELLIQNLPQNHCDEVESIVPDQTVIEESSIEEVLEEEEPEEPQITEIEEEEEEESLKISSCYCSDSIVSNSDPSPSPILMTERPIVLPGGRKWYQPDDVDGGATIRRHQRISDDKIRTTIETHSEVLAGRTKGINFLKYNRPPQSLQYLEQSAVYKMLHVVQDGATTKGGISTRAGKVLAAEDYHKLP